MAIFMRLLAALEILLFLKKLREQNESTKTSNSSSFNSYENQIPEEHQVSKRQDAQSWTKQ